MFFLRPNETTHEICKYGKFYLAVLDGAKQNCVRSILYELLSFQSDHYIMHMDFLFKEFKADINGGME